MGGAEIPPEQGFDAVVKLFEAGRHDEAAAMCRKLLEQSPGDLSATNMLGVIAATRGDFQEAAKCFERCAVAAPRDSGVAANLAQALLNSGDRERALDRFRHAAALGGGDGSRLQLFENTDFDPERVATGERYVHHLEDALIDTGYWAIHHGQRMFFRETANFNPGNSPWIKGRVTPDLRYAVVDIPTDIIEVETPCVFLGGDENYSHWFMRYLMRLALIEDRADLENLPLLTIDSLRPYQTETLVRIGYDESRLITVPRNVALRCAEIHIPVCLRTDIGGMAIGMHWLRDKFLGDSRLKPKPGKRIYISRRDAPSRYLTNEQEILDRLAPFGIEALALSEYSLDEQIALFADAELVVAPHGAGLVNLAFAPANCGVIELVSDPIANMNDFRQIGEILKHRVQMIPCTSFRIDPGATKPAAQHTFTTDPDAVVAAVERALGS